MSGAGLRPSYVVWRYSDGKPGHDNQTLGLLQALRKRVSLEVHEIALVPWHTAFYALLGGSLAATRLLPAPDLLLGAGHATHLSLLATRRARGGRAIVLMRPSLPMRCFDLCLVPAHDGAARATNVLITRGVLNRIIPAASKTAYQGLILLGGPSRHYRWSNAKVQMQIEAIVARDRAWQWTVAGSRRTPSALLDALQALPTPSLTVVRHEAAGPEWLPWRLAAAARVWVSEDSVSMVYEALTSAAEVGLLQVPRRTSNRITRGLDALVADGFAVPYRQWHAGATLQAPAVLFNEADRCADIIARRWLDH